MPPDPPGLQRRAIGNALRRITAQLSLPIQKLIAGGKLKTTGQRRGTRYHAGKGRPVAKKAAGRKKKVTRKKAAKKAVTRKRATKKKAGTSKAA